MKVMSFFPKASVVSPLEIQSLASSLISVSSSGIFETRLTVICVASAPTETDSALESSSIKAGLEVILRVLTAEPAKTLKVASRTSAVSLASTFTLSSLPLWPLSEPSSTQSHRPETLQSSDEVTFTEKAPPSGPAMRLSSDRVMELSSVSLSSEPEFLSQPTESIRAVAAANINDILYFFMVLSDVNYRMVRFRMNESEDSSTEES